MTTELDGSPWRDFAHTLRVAIASVRARDELAHGNHASAAGPRELRRFAVALLAAAGAEGLTLPRSEVLADGSALAVSFEEHPAEGVINVRLQLKGYAAVKENGGRAARLVGGNGAFDEVFRFERSGSAHCALKDDAAVRAGLTSFTVVVLDE